MNQTRLESAIEAVFNMLIGCVIAFSSQYLIFPLVGIHEVTFEQHLAVTVFFTAVSLLRSYFIRRWCNRHIQKVSSGLGHLIREVV